MGTQRSFFCARISCLALSIMTETPPKPHTCVHAIGGNQGFASQLGHEGIVLRLKIL